MTLSPRGTEFLLIGQVGADFGSMLVFVHEYDGEMYKEHSASASPRITLTVVLIEAARGRVAALRSLSLPLARADDVPPSVTLTR